MHLSNMVPKNNMQHKHPPHHQPLSSLLTKRNSSKKFAANSFSTVAPWADCAHSHQCYCCTVCPTHQRHTRTHASLDYVATQEDAVLTYNKSDMILAVHRDASYLSEPKARSRADGHFFLSTNAEIPPNNGAILNIAHIIKHVMSSATEAELAALYIMAREAVYIRIILNEMGHKQPPTPMQTDNAMAEAVVNAKIQPKRTKAMDMRFHWLRD